MAGLFFFDMKLLAIIISALLLFADCMAQELEKKNADRGKEILLDWALQKDSSYKHKHENAKKIAKKYNLEMTYQQGKGGIAVLQYFKKGKPVYFITNNINAAGTISANLLWPDFNAGFSLDGEAVEVGLWDGGAVLNEHHEFSDFPDKVWQRDKPSITLNHSTHVAGTIKAEGKDADGKGIAPMAKLLAYDFNNSISEMAVAASENLLLSNHSYGKVCGWTYNSSNENWFWYGDVSLDLNEDVDFGYYDSLCWDIDYITFNAPNYLIVKSAGNDRGEGPEDQPVQHYEWNDGWVTSNDVHNVDGGESGYRTVCSMAASKNALVVGAVQDLSEGYINPEMVQVESYSAWGPTSDGRIKPDLMANGAAVYSCISDGEDQYDAYSGTSMSAASASGAIALLLQLQQQLQPGVNLWASTVKGLLIQTADECGFEDGPDYMHGYGLLNAYKAAELLRSNVNAGGDLIIQGDVYKEESEEILIRTDEGYDQLKVTLCWTDPPGPVCDQESNAGCTSLVNDIDLTIEDENGNLYYPWILDADQPELAATKGENHSDNLEQIVINNSAPGNYIIRVNGNGISEGDKQSFSLISEGHMVNNEILPPANLIYRIVDEGVQLAWGHSGSNPTTYAIYMNNQMLIDTEDTSCVITDVEKNVVNTFYITARYQLEEEKESLPTNAVDVIIKDQASVPYLVTFDDDIEGWEIKNTYSGWRWGNSDSLSSYYLHFENNSTPFLWIDSGIMNTSTHVSDIAWSLPINLKCFENISLSFDYVLMTDRYDVIDDLFVVCRQVGDKDWKVLADLSQSSDWRFNEIPISDEFASENFQIGFYYDDYYRWGMGAAIDNVYLNADFATKVLPITTTDPIININDRIYLNLNNGETGNFNWFVYDVTGRLIDSGVNALLSGQASFKIKDVEPQIVIIKIQFQHLNIVSKIFKN
ncbi:S8 family serine peptidase [Carboxylicivirga linearis]|uniref:S8 family serine peptidase n=1 Tax=Carboxylicivirga linearis TaxID=1628157 RepID=A0ABS5JZR7_9BACT|nr:S8 family serine peptidase [Carboxylicivirga linearis]MBS2100358.1 S8 family serine peptidase [Carboxylicivirga linearis]